MANLFNHFQSALEAFTKEVHDRVKENAINHKQLFFNELLRVIAHGNLHLIGYKDKTKKDSIAMREAEEQWILRYYELHP